MQPPNPTLSDYFAPQIHHQSSQYYSYFPPQNPNPNPNPNSYSAHHQHQLQIEPPQPNPPGAETYFQPSYPISYTGNDYNAHVAGTAYDAHYAVSGYDASYAGTVYDAQSVGVSGAYDVHNASVAYDGQQGGYSQTVSAVPPNSYTADLLARNWAEAELSQQYGNSLYASAAGTLSQDDSRELLSIPTHSKWTNSNVQPWKKIPKKIKIAQSAWCEVCKIECNSTDILYKHKLGRKHIKNVEKLNSIASAPATSTSTTYVNPAVIGPMENPKKVTKNKAETPEQLEMKRRKVLEGGASANAVRTCGICNVVCNSDTVFRFHLSGQKHASMVKKSEQIGAV